MTALTRRGCSVSLSRMGWLLLTFTALACSVGGVAYNVRQLHRAEGGQEHLRLSVRFWKTLAGMGFIVAMLLVGPLLGWGVLKSLAAQTAAVLAMVPPMVLVGIGSYNARALQRSLRRRTLALEGEGLVRGVVVARERRALSSDLIEVAIEADLPTAGDAADSAYRPRDLDHVRRHRFVEVFPSDQWLRFEPGATVELAYVPSNLEHFAVRRVFSPPPALPGATTSQAALPEAAEATVSEV